MSKLSQFLYPNNPEKHDSDEIAMSDEKRDTLFESVALEDKARRAQIESVKLLNDLKLQIETESQERKASDDRAHKLSVTGIRISITTLAVAVIAVILACLQWLL